MPFAGGSEFGRRDAANVIGGEDLGLLARDAVDVPASLRMIEVTYTRMGEPTGEIETRLAACRFDDLHRARRMYAERALELRRVPAAS